MTADDNREDFEELRLDLNEMCVKNPTATWFARVRNNAWESDSILPGDLLVIDRSVSPSKNALIVAIIDEEFMLRRFIREVKGRVVLQSGGSAQFITVDERDIGYAAWGVL